MTTCECPASGYCQRYLREMGERSHSICQGTSGLSPEDEAKYRANWAGLAARSGTQSANQVPCVHLGDEIRREQCPTCSGKILIKVMACAIHTETQGQSQKIKGVASCCGCPEYQGAIE